MEMDKNLLFKLCDSHGVSGFEEETAEIILSELKKSCKDAHIDKFGNVIAKKGNGSKKIMIAAHMDEIGLIIKYIDDKGFLRFAKIGGIDDRIILNQRVIIKTSKGKVFGVIGSKPPHVLTEEESKQIIKCNDMFIDIGAKDKNEALKMGVEIGDTAIFYAPGHDMNNELVTAKALDNRIGCFALIELAKKLKSSEYTVYFVATSQEEVSALTGKGGRVSTFTIKPDYFVGLDTTVAGGHPEMQDKDAPVYLNKGPAIVLLEASGRGNIANKEMVKWLKNAAKKAKIDIQPEVVVGGATDSTNASTVEGGVPCVSLGIPTRYIHSCVSIASMKDTEKTVELLLSALQMKI